MRKQLLLLVGAILFLSNLVVGQTTFDWLDTAPDGNWKQGAGGARWNPGGLWDQPGTGILRFNNNHQLSMTNNVTGTYEQHKITFGSSNSQSRTISGNTLRFVDYSTAWPWVKNESNATHNIGLPIIGPNSPYNLELIANAGSLVFTNTIDNNGRTIQIYGNNTAVDATNRFVRLGGVVSGSGILNISQYGVVKLNTNHSYTGETQIDNGELWIETSGDISGGGIIYVGNGAQLDKVAKLYLSKSDGGTTFTRTISINNGNALSRFLGGINNSGVNTFSAGIVISASKPLNLEATSSGGTTEFTGIISGDGTVTTLGAGTTLFSNSNTYTGATTVSAGTLELQGSLASSSITVTNGATLKINGTGVTINALTVNSGGFVEIMPGKSLTITGALANSGTFTINSDASGTGSLITNSTVSGNVTVERYVAAANWALGTDGWHLISSPVASQAISGAWTPDGTSSNNYDFYAWSEPNNIWVNFKNTTITPTWNEVNTNTNFTVGKAYIAAYQAESTNTFVGIPNKDDVSGISISRTIASYTNQIDAGFNVLGNPYPSAIKWNDGNWTLTNISATAKVWNNTSKSYDDIGVNGIIPASNGFLVQLTSGTTGSITIPAASRVHNTATWYKSNDNSKIKLLAREESNNSAQSSNIILDMNAQFAYDANFDSRFLIGYAPQFYSLKDENRLSTYATPSLTDDLIIPFCFVKNAAETFSIELVETIEGQVVYLTDKKTNTIQKLTENPIYSFTSEASDSPDRFLIHFGVVGIDEPKNENSLNAYVYGDRLYVMNTSGKANLQLFDLQGRLVQSSVLNGTGLQSQSVNLPAGVYVVRVNDEKSVKSVKLVIE